MDTSIDQIGRSWDQRTGEPDIWYSIFKNYYLPLGERRSLRNAFELYLRVEKPKNYVDMDPDNLTNIPQHWNQIASEYEWAMRAADYDEEKMPDFSAVYVNQVLQYLSAHAMQAAESLVKALNSDRTRVQAANSVLNRIGVPETSEINLRTGVSITSDDMAEASSKVEQWKSRKLNG